MELWEMLDALIKEGFEIEVRCDALVPSDAIEYHAIAKKPMIESEEGIIYWAYNGTGATSYEATLKACSAAISAKPTRDEEEAELNTDNEHPTESS